MHKTLSDLQESLSQALRGLGPDQTQLRPSSDPGCWSIQQIAQHLMLTYISTSSVIETRIAKGTPTKASPTLQQRVGQFVLITLGRFPKGRKAPAAVDPTLQPAGTPALSGNALALAASDQIIRLDSLAQSAQTLFGRQRAISHMVMGPLSVPQWRKFHLVHGLHHVRQITAIRTQNGL